MRTRDEIVAPLHSERLVELVDWWLAGLVAVDPRRLVTNGLTKPPGPVTVLALGKAAVGMAWGAEERLSGRIKSGLVITDAPADTPPWARSMVGGHPLPTDASVEAGRAAYDLVRSLQPEDHLVALVSGGGSALMDLPHPQLELDVVREVIDALLHRGAPIGDINGVRTAMSLIKGGGLARVCACPITTAVLSDVPGSEPGAVASGPTAGSPPSPEAIAACLARYGITGAPADQVVELAAERVGGRLDVDHEVITLADGRDAGRAVVEAARVAGVQAELVSEHLTGEAAEAAGEALHATEIGTIRVLAGETTVSVGGPGIGGRNQHAALAISELVQGTADAFLAAGTDGIDGPTDAAGAVVDGTTPIDASRAQEALAAYDSHRVLDVAGSLIRTGRTGTNVADIWIVDRRR